MFAKILGGLFTVFSLGVFVAGVAQGQWYGAFGIVLVMTSLLCNVVAYLGVAPGELPHERLSEDPRFNRESLRAAPRLRTAS
jgi:hypothetical protein